MVERIGKEEGKLLAQGELQRAIDELNAARVLHENKFYYKSVSTAYYSVYRKGRTPVKRNSSPKPRRGSKDV